MVIYFDSGLNFGYRILTTVLENKPKKANDKLDAKRVIASERKAVFFALQPSPFPNAAETLGTVAVAIP